MPTNLVHRDDAIAAVIAALAFDETRSGIVHVCDDDHRSRRELVDAAARVHGLPRPVWPDEVADGAPARGKIVDNGRLRSWLRVDLLHPTHELFSG